MSFFTDASLVMVPSGIKDQKVYSIKPTDGSGDLTFSRASNATRVNSSGLVEKVRTNELTYSNDFSNAVWTKGGTTSVTPNAGTDPNGGNNAWQVVMPDAGNLYQTSTANWNGAQSIYAKVESGSASIKMWNGVTGTSFTLTTSWQRLSVVNVNSSQYVNLYNDSGSSVTFLLAFAQAETGDIATDYIATTSSAVSVGPVSGLPRLDYSGGCPSLLLEPQRTNLATYSEQFDNAAWLNGDVIVTANQTTSPDGYTNADKIESNTTAIPHYFGPALMPFVTGTTYTSSVFVKKDTGRYLQMLYGSGGFSVTSYANFDLQEGVVSFTGADATAKISDYSNGWYRCSITSTCATGFSDSTYSAIITTPTAARVETHTTALSYWLYGYQVEAGAYATSYIPTLSTAVTRVKDECSKSGISSLIGQTTGTIFIDYNIISPYQDIIVMNAVGLPNNDIAIIFIGSTLAIYGFNSAVEQFRFNLTGYKNTSRYKIAIGYANNDVVCYINGVLVGQDTSSSLNLTDSIFYNSGDYNGHNIHQSLLFKTRLSNADLATLTTI